MFCPECKAEFRTGFTICVQCNRELIEEFPPLNSDIEYIEFTKILTTSNLSELTLIKTVLENNNIIYTCNDETLSNLYASALPVIIMVNTNQFNLAKDVITDLHLKHSILTDKENITSFRSKLECPNCNAHLHKKYEVCPNCKVPLYECTNCNGFVLKNSDICPHCNEIFE